MTYEEALEYGYQNLGGGYWYDPSDGTTFDPTRNAWVDGSAVDDNQAQSLVVQAANNGWDVGTISQNLLQLGYTASQLAMLYQNVKSSGQATPQVLDYLARENQYLQTNTGTTNQTLLWVAAGVAVVLLLSQRRQAA